MLLREGKVVSLLQGSGGELRNCAIVQQSLLAEPLTEGCTEAGSVVMSSGLGPGLQLVPASQPECMLVPQSRMSFVTWRLLHIPHDPGLYLLTPSSA